MPVLSRLWAAETSHKMTVTSDPNCGHRGGWLAYVRAVGFPDLIEAADLAPLKARLGMPDCLIFCDMAEVGAHVAERRKPFSTSIGNGHQL